MLANKLEEMKKKLLLQTKKEKVEVVGSPVRVENVAPVVQVEASPEHTSNPIRLHAEASISQSVDESVENYEEEENEPIEQEQQQAVVEPVILKQNPQPIIADNSENVVQQVEKEKLEVGEIQQVEEQKIVSQGLVSQLPEKIQQEHQSLQLIHEPNISVSIDEQVRQQAIQSKLAELQKEVAAEKPAESKAQKKTKKIVLKQLIKVKECIRNLQSSLKGLQYVQQKLKLYPSLKGRLHSYVQQLRNLSNS